MGFFIVVSGFADPYFFERTQVYAQMRRWLRYVQWYTQLTQGIIFGEDPLYLLRVARDPP
uniref:Uncharacterized protein n=1 Tax=Utricularia reniformis TaxID=192314 RepID=A0A1Y0B2K1_9LAMI|nr:hypothetical protein AEK19_MT1476 [Utricularia reniformis]ART31666.1 hypothetical protein AEK19_MT1476 [Utricularia reniformis]